MDTHVLMSVKTVTLSADAYSALASRKRRGESFSDVVRRLTTAEESPLAFVGAWKDFPAPEMEEFERWMTWSDKVSASEHRAHRSAR